MRAPAPSADRTANSRSRAAIRARIRFATLTQAISSSPATAPSSSQATRDGVADQIVPQRHDPWLSVWPGSYRSDAAGSLGGRFNDGCDRGFGLFRRDAGLQAAERRKERTVERRRSDCCGRRISAWPPGIAKPAGRTPITGIRLPFRSMVRPMAPGSAPKRRVQTSWLMIATGGAPRTSSSGVKSRPRASRTPNV